MNNPFHLLSLRRDSEVSQSANGWCIEVPEFRSSRLIDDIAQCVYERYDCNERGNNYILAVSFDEFDIRQAERRKNKTAP